MAAGALRRHFAAGRLDEHELDARLDRVLTARTRGDLAELVADLPADRGVRVARGLYRVQRALLPYHAAGFAATNGALVGAWEATGGGAFWPAWWLAPTTAALAAHALASRALRRTLGLRERGGEPHHRR